ncbi:MAG: TolB family protein [Candidatus Methanospirareceae archaeon]
MRKDIIVGITLAFLVLIFQNAAFVSAACIRDGAFCERDSQKILLYTQLTTNLSDDLNPTWSPDGSKIAFTSNREGNFDIWLINSDGTGLEQLTDEPTDEKYPAWSHSGDKIAFVRYDPNVGYFGGYYLCVMNANGTGEVTLPLSPDQDYWEFEILSPVWSPDDNQIAFVSYGPQGGSLKIYKYNLATHTVTEITPQNEMNPWGLIQRISWSSVRNLIAYDRYPFGIQTFNPEGGDYQRVTTIEEWEGVPIQPDWSPDGEKIVFSMLSVFPPYTPENLAIVDFESSEIVILDNTTSKDVWPSWSPDGTKIAFVSDRSGNNDIWIMTLAPPTPLVEISIDKYEYKASETMLINITLANPTDELQSVYFAWRLDLPDYDWHRWIMIMPLHLPPKYKQTFTIPLTLGNYGISFNASWCVALFDVTYKVISKDNADWRYVSTVATGERTMFAKMEELCASLNKE